MRALPPKWRCSPDRRLASPIMVPRFSDSIACRRRDSARAELTAARAAGKGFVMTLPKNTKPMIWGAVIGAILCAVLGFGWGGWVTGSTASKDASIAAHNATVAALAPFCAERFRAQSDSAAR